MTQETRIARRSSEELSVPITKEQAMFLLKTIWPKAPEVEIIKASILCQQYGLNPLMHQVYLVPFKDKEGIENWVTILGIKATRQIAQQALKKRGIRYFYQDGPRVMTKKEQVKILGQVESDKIWAITILANQEGNIYPGYGFYPTKERPYGADKGNDAHNMAFIRSERNALDKLAPGELPDIEVGDDTYITGDYHLALKKGEEQFNAQVKKDITEFWPEGKSEPEPLPDAPESQKEAGEGRGDRTELLKRDKPEESLPEFKNGIQLVNYAQRHGWKWDNIKMALVINSPAEIKDVLEAAKILFPDKFID